MITADSYSSLDNRESNLQAVIQMQVAYQKGVEQMEVFEAVRTVLSVRNYKETPVPPDLVRRIVEAGRLSGSAVNVSHGILLPSRTERGKGKKDRKPLSEVAHRGRFGQPFA